MASLRQLQPSKTIHLDTKGAKPGEGLPFNRKVGHLKVGPNRPIGKESKFFFTCDCGNSGWLTAGEMREILCRYSGCGEPDCTALSFDETVWTSRDSLRIQLFALLLLCPEDVQSFWGGTMDDMYEGIDFEEALINLSLYLEDNDCGGVWLGRVSERLPFMETNVRLSSKPDKVLLNFSKAKIEVEGEDMTMKELCGIGNLSPDELLLRLYELGTTDDLLINLMENK